VHQDATLTGYLGVCKLNQYDMNITLICKCMVSVTKLLQILETNTASIHWWCTL